MRKPRSRQAQRKEDGSLSPSLQGACWGWGWPSTGRRATCWCTYSSSTTWRASTRRRSPTSSAARSTWCPSPAPSYPTPTSAASLSSSPAPPSTSWPSCCSRSPRRCRPSGHRTARHRPPRASTVPPGSSPCCTPRCACSPSAPAGHGSMWPPWARTSSAARATRTPFSTGTSSSSTRPSSSATPPSSISRTASPGSSVSASASPRPWRAWSCCSSVRGTTGCPQRRAAHTRSWRALSWPPCAKLGSMSARWGECITMLEMVPSPSQTAMVLQAKD
uniref:Uncharacterized protein n=1 Tax=Arundo donax TaxID=35708 RepID=A0A0A9E9B5_ARUDO